MRSLPRTLLLLALGLATAAAQTDEGVPRHGLAMHGDLKYGPDFQHFDYADPDAPKGGTLRLASIGTFDSLNPFILKGSAPAGSGWTLDTLMVKSDDEPFSAYGLVAESVETPPDRSWVAFTLRPEARFHDGSPITVEDVIFSLETLRGKGHPFYRSYYANVASATKTGEHRVRFDFAPGENRELPLIVGELPILSKTYWSTREFDKTSLEAPLGSGPYRIAKVDPGRSIRYERVEDYWARDLPVNRGRYNFATIRYDYYRDTTVALQALKAGEYDLREENVSKNWATAYDIPAVTEGRLIKEEIRHERPTGMQGFLFNTRRPMFRDPRVRRALAYAFDYEWTNKNLFYGAYTRTGSYFSNSELANRGLPEGDELAVLEPFRAQLPAEVFTTVYAPPASNGSGNIRRNLRTALRLLKQAGWEVRDGKLTNTETGAAMRFEILLVQPDFERIVLPFARNLERLGIEAKVRTVDATQYQNRIEEFDFDLIVHSIGQSLSPGNEQRDLWGSDNADVPGSRNLAGVRDPVVDALVDQVISAPDRRSLVDRTRALDRVLLWGHYTIPQWHIRSYRLAHWDKFGRPAVSPKYALGLDTWWLKQAARPTD